MLILLPPSETKADGGDGPPVELDRLSFPELNAGRKELADELVALDYPSLRGAAADRAAARLPPGWRWARRCSGCCAPTTRCRPIGCPRAPRCPAGRV